MPNLLNRPYQGNWQPNARKVVKHTPDALFFINGDVAIPGCPKCNGRINIQRFIKQVSIEAGTTPGSHSGQASLSVPRIHGEQLFKEGRAVLRPGLEVHIYLRGYFPVQGQFAHLQDPSLSFGSGNDAQSVQLDKMAAYPYYHCFHGVVTNVNYEYSDGFYSASMSFASLFHFWQYHNMAMNGAVLGSRPENSEVKMSLWGNDFSNMHPYGVIYTLFRSTTGAAGGVEFVLDDSTNIDAYSEISGEQLYKMAQMYWEERFKTTIQNLRMYGVNGTLFNSAQQAFLATRNNDQLTGLLNQTSYMEGKQTKARDPYSGNLAVAKQLGLAGEGLDIVFADRVTAGAEAEGGKPLSLNVTSMYAFTKAFGDAGNISEFETTYRTKLDIAQQATEAIGFEFYQDMDGDLVFKPPFYNLDTSSSRVYRIEDIDIISINFLEKEPNATYCTVKSGQITHWAGTGTEGFAGNRGQYIDYRLVAQFGWRPANFEVTYFSSPKALQFVAQARLDILNIDINSAQLTIPIRPELKPGYPVYIVREDCFYYVTQLSHNFAFGSMCTTTMTLTGRRTKFFAPGKPRPIQAGENAINLIRLDRPDYPERPLQVYENGIPRWKGFPNVVMALDPLRANPKFFMMGSGLENLNVDINNAKLFVNLVIDQVKQTENGAGIFAISPTASEEEREQPTLNTSYVLKQSDSGQDNIEFSINDLLQEFQTLQDARKELEKLGRQISAKYQSIEKGSNPDQVTRKIKPLEKRLAEVRATATGQTADGGLLRVVKLIQALQSSDLVRRAIPGMFDAPATASYLDMLGDLKSSFAPGEKTPGYYRYYSCSHPDPEMQGQSALNWDEGSGNDLGPSQADTGVSAQTQQAIPPQPIPLPPSTPGDENNPKAQLAKLDEQLAAIGVVDFNSRQLAQRTSEEKRQSGKAWKRVRGEPIPDEVVDNMTNMGFVLQLLKNELPAGVSITVANGWRPGDREGKQRKAESRIAELDEALADPNLDASTRKKLEKDRGVQDRKRRRAKGGFSTHFAGLAADIDVQPRGDAEAVRLAREAVAKLAIQGVIKGFGTYSDGGSRIHIDLRDGALYKQSCPYTYRQTNGAHNGRGSNPTQQIVNDVAAQMGVPSVGNGTGNQCPEFQYPAPIVQGPNLIKKQRRKSQPTPPPATPTPPPAPALQRKVEPPKISLEVQRLPEPIFVQGFIDGPLPIPEGVTRPPEAALDEIRCERGIRLAQGRVSAPRIVPTSEIQTTSFAAFSANKSTEVAGLSNEQGLFLPEDLRKAVAKSLLSRIKQETESLVDDPTKTPADILKDLYDQIRDELLIGQGTSPNEDPLSNSFPVYESQDIQSSPAEARFSVLEYRAVELQDFENAVFVNDLFATGGADVSSAANVSLAKLQTVKPFAKKTLGLTFETVAASYAASVAEAVTNAFELARTSAGYTEGLKPFGFNARMAEILDAFNSIVRVVTGKDFDTAKRVSQDRAVRLAKNRITAYTPVFPVSDASGYEVIGSFRYGRGLTINPGGSFDRINSSPDPFVGVSAEAAEAYLQALTAAVPRKKRKQNTKVLQVQELLLKNERLRQEIEEGLEIDPSLDEAQRNNLVDKRIARLSEIRVALAAAAEADPDAIEELAEFNDTSIEKLKLDNPDPTLLETKLANFPANSLKEGVLKTTVVNAATQLADLGVHLRDRNNETCSCRGADADILLAAYARNDFLTINDISPTESPAFASVSEQILQDLPEYLAQRQALRGQTLDTQSPGLAEAFAAIKDIRNVVNNLGSGPQSREIARSFRDTGAQFRDINLGGG